MSSEDWKAVNFEDMERLVVHLRDDEWVYSAARLENFLNQVKLIRDKQIKENTKQVPALFKERLLYEPQAKQGN